MRRAFIRISAEHLASARALAEVPPFSLPPEEAAAMFAAAASPTGQEPATVHLAAGVFNAEQWAALEGLAENLPWAEMEEYDIQADPTFPQRLLEDLGLQRIVQEMNPGTETP